MARITGNRCSPSFPNLFNSGIWVAQEACVALGISTSHPSWPGPLPVSEDPVAANIVPPNLGGAGQAQGPQAGGVHAEVHPGDLAPGAGGAQH